MEPISVELIKAAQNGDEQAFQTIYEKAYPHVYSYALRLCKNEADAKDIAQETFIQVYQSIQDLQRPEAFPLWLNRIVYSKFHRILSKQKETAIEQDQLEFHVDQSDKAKQINDSYLLDDKAIIHNMINQLSEKQREVIRLMYYEQYTTSEIAEYLNLPEGTVKSRIFEAKKSLQKQIKAFEQAEQRKLILHTDALLPATTIALLAKIRDILHHSSLYQKLLAFSCASMVVFSTAAVSQTIPYVQNHDEPSEESLPKPVFHAVNVQDITINNAQSAYYFLMDWAPDKAHLNKKTAAEKQEVQAIIMELKQMNSPYYQRLLDDGWLQEYEK